MNHLLRSLRQIEKLIVECSTGKRTRSDDPMLALVHEGLLHAYGELGEDGMTLRSSQNSTKGLYRLVTGAMKELSESDIPPTVDVTSVRSVMDTWKNSYFIKALQSYGSIEELKNNIPYCFACFKTAPLEVAHIISRGAETRLVNSVDNMMLFCHKCHIETQHQNGWDILLMKHPHLYPRIERARRLMNG